MEPSDEELMTGYQEGNKEKLEAIFMRYQKRIFNFALRYLGNRADAEDVTAEIFLVLLERKDSYRTGQAKFSTWLYTVARNACISRTRRRQNIFSLSWGKPNEPEGEWEIPDPNTPAETLQQQEIANQIQNAVQGLPVSQKETLILREYHGLSYDQISKITGHSLENVKVLIFRAREQLRQDLGSFLREVQS